jgi:opacity protein-like surface antigen
MNRPMTILLMALTLGPAAAQASPSGTISIQARGSYFSPSDEVFRGIYGYGTSWGGEISFAVTKRLAAWAGGDYIIRTGKLPFTEDETKIRIVPLSAGAKYFLAFGRLRPYVGAGLGYFQYRETNSIGTVEKGNIGFLGRAGVVVNLGATFFMDLQGGWSTCRVQPLDVAANIGGFSLGLGLGFEF